MITKEFFRRPRSFNRSERLGSGLHMVNFAEFDGKICAPTPAANADRVGRGSPAAFSFSKGEVSSNRWREAHAATMLGVNSQ
ncbi:hypothetical protein [Phenylobacterium sp.]|uniref:hypothetical protein n=1 Tax=Phenylobacterium sp. TaxID=1871053 RepID=UPI0035B396A4